MLRRMPRFVASLETGKSIPSSPRKILVPVDFSDESAAALRYATTIAQQSGGAIDVVHVWDSSSYASADTVGGIHDAASEAMQKFLEPFAGNPGISGNVTSGEAARVIADLSAEYELVVMGRRAQDGATEAIVGSVAAKVIADAKCPVLTVVETEE
jgi:nucleotide-binding universal stress UspA family protein